MVSKLLDILKLEHSDIHLALFVVFGLFLLGEHFGWIPPLAVYPWVIPLAWFGLLLFGVLFVLKVVSALLDLLVPKG